MKMVSLHMLLVLCILYAIFLPETASAGLGEAWLDINFTCTPENPPGHTADNPPAGLQAGVASHRVLPTSRNRMAQLKRGALSGMSCLAQHAGVDSAPRPASSFIPSFSVITVRSVVRLN